MKFRLLSRFLPLFVFISGCAAYRDIPPGTVKTIAPSPLVEKVDVSAAPARVDQEPSPSLDYVIGPNDVLLITISGKPEFTVGGGSGKVQGNRVDGSGNVHLPLAGAVAVGGLTVPQAQERIRERLQAFLNAPSVVVEVAEYRSQPIYLLGKFRNPGTYYLDRPLTLLQGIALGNGFDGSANIRGARLSRGGKIQPVDLHDLLTGGDTSQNVWLKPGDTIYLPDDRSEQVFVFGAVKKPGAIPFPTGGLTLTQAIANAELRENGFDFNHVRIIRSLSTTRGELLVVDFDRMLRGRALPFQLKGGDVVYVPKNNFGTWNDAIAEILPSLQAVSSFLQPFVSIKFLSE